MTRFIRARPAALPAARRAQRVSTAVSKLVVGHHLVDHAQLIHPLRGYGGSGVDQLTRPAGADQPRQPHRAARAGEQPPAGVSVGEHRSLGRYHQVAGEDKLEPARGGRTVDRRDHRRRVGLDAQRQLAGVVEELLDRGQVVECPPTAVRSAPAQNAGPLPVSTTTRAPSAAARSRPASIPARTSVLIALRFSGRLSRIQAAGPRRSYIVARLVTGASVMDHDTPSGAVTALLDEWVDRRWPNGQSDSRMADEVVPIGGWFCGRWHRTLVW